VPFSVVQERIAQFLAARTSTQPLFLYVNFEDTHFPYHHKGVQPILNLKPIAESDISPSSAGALRATYANTAANVDRAIGEVLEMVRRARRTDPGVIVSADHGESLFDDGVLGHGVGLTDTQTRIPLIVANLPMVIKQPIGQADLRDAIGSALSSPESARRSPTLSDDAGSAVFQYLGTLVRPAQIALTRPDGRLIFDFRSNLVQPRGTTEWREPDALSAADRVAFLQLVRTWERMLLARQRAGR
jgi:predicted AlkP superfamily pyrophosphatase or phosphodiesterase